MTDWEFLMWAAVTVFTCVVFAIGAMYVAEWRAKRRR